MPVIARPSRPRQPSGLEKFLQLAGGLTNIAGGVADVITLPRRLDQLDQQLEQGRQNIAIADRQIAIQEAANERAERASHVDEDTALVNAITAMTVTGRNRLYDMMEAGQMPNGSGGFLPASPVNPALRGSAVTLGDVLPEYRESTRAALARKMGVDVSQVPNSMILSEENEVMQGLISKENMRYTFEAMMDPNNQGAFKTAAGEGIAANLSGETGRPLGQISTEDILARFTENEFLRVDPTSGEVSGMLVNNPAQAREMAFAAQGLPAPRNEYDIGGQRVMLPSSVYDEIFKFNIQSALRTEEEAARIGLQTASDIAEKHGIPMVVAQAMVNGDLTALPAQWRQVANDVQNTNLAAIRTLAQFRPFQAIIQAGEIGKSLGIDEGDMSKFVEGLLDTAAKNNGSMIVPRNMSFWQRMGALVPGGRAPFGAGVTMDPTNTAVGYGQQLAPAFSLTPGVTQQDAMNAMPVFAQQMVELLSTLSPTQQAAELADMARSGALGSDGTFVAIDPTTINLIREELRRRNSTVPPQ